MKTRILIASIGLLTAGPGFASDYFTEHFDYLSFDLEGQSLWFNPTNSPEGYVVTEGDLEEDWVDDSDVSGLLFYEDYNSYYYTIPNGKVYLYDQQYGAFWLNSNGNITFGTTQDTTYPATLEHHFDEPRISMLLTDLYTYTYYEDRGRISLKNTGSSIVITFTDIPHYSSSLSYNCTFQCQMFFTGEIRLSWREVNIYSGYSSSWTDAVVGLSPGGGIPEDYVETDFYSDSSDVDEDGLEDSWEIAYFSNTSNCDPTDDSDGDGYDNRAEYICGTIPNDALSHFQLNTFCQDDCAILNWNSVSGRTYRVTATTNLTEQFTTISGALPYTQTSFTTGVEQARFFKVDINY